VDIGTPAGNGGGPEPAGDATDPHKVRHDEIACLSLQCLVHVAGAVEVLADLQRRFQLAGQLGIAVEVVVDDRLLDPGEATIVDQVATLQRLGKAEALIEVDH
jgi:hypothetical protein